MSHYIVLREGRGTVPNVRIGISRDGEPTYCEPGDELRLADEASADAFIRLCRRDNLRLLGQRGPYFALEIK